MVELRKYQKEVKHNVINHLKEHDRCCVSLATGAGKTILFSELVKDLEGRTLICVHREELVNQTSNTLTMDHELLLPKVKTVSKNIVVAMVQTLANRIKKGAIDIDSFDNLIVDECHRGEFMKILDLFNGKVIGFTATPNYEKTKYFYKCLSCGNEELKAGKCCKRKLKKFRENVPLSDYYHTLIEGVEIHELIEQGFLVPDENFIADVDTSKLVYDHMTKDYTEESIGLVFGSDEAIENTIKTYYKYAEGRKTILFNPNTLVNKKLFKAMDERGLNVKMYDSKNSEENRKELVEWLNNTPDAILLNVQVFTTGLDVTDIEVVFLNKKTKSVNLYLQMVGRGGRLTKKILKASFRVIDMGKNNEDFGNWSKPRDWNSMFSFKEKKEVGNPRPAAVRTCHECESIVSANSLYCEFCGVERKYTGGLTSGLPKRQGKLIIPTPEKIIEYCENNNISLLDSRKIVYNYVAEMFDETPLEVYQKYKLNREIYIKTFRFIQPYYFALQDSKLEGNRVMTLRNFTNKTIDEIERRYNSRTDF